MTDRSEHDTVAFDVIDRVAWVRFNRPEKRNCMSPKLNRRMKQVLEELDARLDQCRPAGSLVAPIYVCTAGQLGLDCSDITGTCGLEKEMGHGGSAF